MTIKTRTKTIAPAALDVLGQMVITDNVAYISLNGMTAGPKKSMPKLERDVYVAVNDVLDALGGKWNRAKQGHVFDADPTDDLDRVVLTGQFTRVKVDLQQFDTPAPLAQRIAQRATNGPTTRRLRMLEPSAGMGRIVDALVAIGAPLEEMVLVEKDPQRAARLGERYGAGGALVHCDDFMTFDTTEAFDAIPMNPPFTRGQDVEHVQRAFAMLAPGGRLVSVMSAGVTFRQDKHYSGFRTFVVQHGGGIEALPAGTFSESGTDVSAVLVTIDK